jgi:signal transduction histidine kinase/putative methionine-R-sulfoxide reductase with GAF domain
MPDENTGEDRGGKSPPERAFQSGEAAQPADPRIPPGFQGGQGAFSRGPFDEHPDIDYEAFPDSSLDRLPRITPLTIALVIFFILSAVALLGVMNLSVLRNYFEGETVFWILRIGLLVMIASIVIYFVLRERSNFKYVERLLDQMAEANKRLALLLHAERDIGSTFELGDTLEQTLSYAFEVTSAQMGAVYLWDKVAESLKLALVKGVDERKMSFQQVSMGQGAVGRAASERKSMIIDEASTLYESDNVFFGASTPASQAIVPLAAGDKLVGVLVVGNARPHRYSSEEKVMLEGLSELASLSVTNTELYRIARKSLDAASRQREITGLVLDEMAAGVMTADSRGRVAIFNREAQRLTGYGFVEVSRAPLQSGLPLEQSPLGPLQQGLLQALQAPSEPVTEGSASIMRKDRSLLSVSYRINPLVEGTAVLGASAVFLERKEPPREVSGKDDVDFQLLLRSLGSRIERLYMQPLARVIEHVRMMDIDDWARSRDDMVRVLEAGAGALMGLLEDVEQYLNCVAFREWDSPAEWDLGPMVAEAVEQVLRMPESEGVVVSVNLGGLPAAFGYERMMRSALEQVLENAVIASAEGEKRVEVTSRVKDGFARVEVRDTGPGVPDEAREYIYQPFFTTREGRSGLGLAVVKRVMQKLGGRVGHAKAARGAVFFLEFPTSTAAGHGGYNGATAKRER